jgi:pantothenate kinase-related protein Tda10
MSYGLPGAQMHVAKNYLKDRGAFDTQTQVPLILGIWGGKGQGKTFQTELAFKKLGCDPLPSLSHAQASHVLGLG